MTTQFQPRRVSGKRAAVQPQAGSPRWLIYYYVVLFVCQLVLVAGIFPSARFVFRGATYGMSLAALAFTGASQSKKSSLVPFALAILGILVVELANPGTPSAIAGFATIAMYLSILGPIFWVPRLAVDLKWFRYTVLLIWAFQSISALVGVLQVYMPATFQPAVSTLLSDEYISTLQIRLANGQRILRPSGLTDTPGAASSAGTYAILLALGLWADRPKRLLRFLLAVSIALGMFTIYICQIRSLVVMLALSLLVALVTSLARGRLKSSMSTTALLGALGVGSFFVAAAVGGDEMINRLSTLTESAPSEVYYANRGIFLEHTLTSLLPEYPLGAGLGRWGMVATNYLGGGPDAIYVEIQWTGWLLDGGVLLILVYLSALCATVWNVWRLTVIPRDGRPNDVSSWAIMLLAYDVGAIALTFNVPVFMSNFGVDFWLLNAALFSAAIVSPLRATVGAHTDESALDP